MPFKKGDKKTGGRGKGSPNKLTRTVREVVLDTFNKLQENPAHLQVGNAGGAAG